MNVLKKEDTLKKYSRKSQPKKKAIHIHNKMLKDIQKEYSQVYCDACKLYEGLIYLLKPFNVKDASVLKKIKLLGITKQIESVVKQKLLDCKILVEVGDSLWFQDDNLGRRIMNEVFFGKRPMVGFDNIERLFYVQN